MDIRVDSKPAFFGNVGQSALFRGNCPYCDTDFEEFRLFGGSNGRDGGFGYCCYCRVRFAWIDSPFECEIQEGV